MPQYMIQFTYARDAWSALARQPFDRTDVLRRFAEHLGGRFISLHYTMGEHDGVAIVDAPDDVTAMAMALRAIGGGHLRTTRTTRLFTAKEVVEALTKAGEIGYAAAER